jgi:dTDP-glucose 4,6-dehydratase
MEQVLVTGGAGFIGSNLVDFIQRGFSNEASCPKVTVLDALTYAGNKTNLEGLAYPSKMNFVHGDVRDYKIVEKLVSGTEVVFHLAAESHVDRSIHDPAIFIDTNVKGTLNVLEAARNFHKKVVLISTDEVYGSLDKGFADEHFKLNPSSPYSASKSSADLLALAYFKTYSLDVIVTRCSNNYGPKQFPEKLVPQTIKKISSGLNIPVYGDGSNIRDWIHVEDHCAGLVLAMQNGKPGEIYNFGDVDKVTNLEIIKAILQIMNGPEDLIEFVADRLGHDLRYAINCNKAKRDLGWMPKHNLSSSLEDVINWYKKTF